MVLMSLCPPSDPPTCAALEQWQPNRCPLRTINVPVLVLIRPGCRCCHGGADVAAAATDAAVVVLVCLCPPAPHQPVLHCWNSGFGLPLFQLHTIDVPVQGPATDAIMVVLLLLLLLYCCWCLCARLSAPPTCAALLNMGVGLPLFQLGNPTSTCPTLCQGCAASLAMLLLLL
jgi:hypothetical protein